MAAFMGRTTSERFQILRKLAVFLVDAGLPMTVFVFDPGEFSSCTTPEGR